MLFLRGGWRGSVRDGLMRVSTSFMRGFWRWIRRRSEGASAMGRGSWAGLCKITMEVHLVVWLLRGKAR